MLDKNNTLCSGSNDGITIIIVPLYFPCFLPPLGVVMDFLSAFLPEPLSVWTGDEGVEVVVVVDWEGTGVLDDGFAFAVTIVSLFRCFLTVGTTSLTDWVIGFRFVFWFETVILLTWVTSSSSPSIMVCFDAVVMPFALFKSRGFKLMISLMR